MKKLFKEVWKSFSKSKILLSGLITLIFMTSGVITLIFDATNSYKTQLKNFKTKSKLHDVTMEAKLKLYGDSPVDFYSGTNVQKYNNTNNLLENQWEYIEKNKYIDGIIIDTNLEYLNLRNYSSDLQQDVFVKTKDLSDLINLNLHIGTKFSDLTGQTDATFTLNIDGKNSIRTYSYENGKYVEVSPEDETIVQISGLLDTYKIFTKTWSSSKDPKKLYDSLFKGINSIVIDKETKKAYVEKVLNSSITSDEYKKYKNNPELFFKISSEDVAAMLGFKSNGEFPTTWQLDTNSNWILDGNIKDYPDKMSIDDFLKQQNVPKIKETFDILYPLPIDKKQKVLSLTIPKKWFVYSEYRYVYTREERKLNGVSATGEINPNEWTGYYRDYLNHLKENNPDRFEELLVVNFWSKDVFVNKVDFLGNKISTSNTSDSPSKKDSLDFKTSLTLEDFNRKIKNSKSEETSIAQIEGIPSPVVNPNIVTQLSTDFSEGNKNFIQKNAEQFKVNVTYEEIKKLVKESGIRETLTITSSDSGKTNIFQFINLGNSNNEIDWNGIKIKQEVGKLINTDLNNPIFSLENSIDNNSDKISIKYVGQIIEKLLNGFSLDREYINPMISFSSFEYLDNSGNLKKSGNSKIIWLTKNGEKKLDEIYGVSSIKESDGKRRYFILEKKSIEIKDAWKSIESLKNGTFDFNQLNSFIIKNNLNFAPFDIYGKDLKVVSNKGWARQDPDYLDKFSIPFQYLLPNSKILEDYNQAIQNPNDNIYGLEDLRDTLISTLTLHVKPLISPWHWDILMNGLNSSFSNYGFAESLKPPAQLKQSVIIKISLGVFRDSIILSNDNFVNSLFGNFFDGIKRQINPTGSSTIEEQQKVLRKYLDSMFRIIELATGSVVDEATILNKVEEITETRYEDVSQIIKDPTLFVESMKNLINSINWDKTVLEFWDNFYVNGYDPRRTVGTGDFVPYLYKNIYSTKTLVTSLQNVVGATVFENAKVSNVLKAFNVPLPSFAETILSGYKLKEFIGFLKLKDPQEGYIRLVKNIEQTTSDIYNTKYKTIELQKILELFTIDLSFFQINLGSQVPAGTGTDILYDPDKELPLEFDLDMLWYLSKFVLVDPSNTDQNIELVSVDVNNFLLSAVSSFIEIKDDYNQIILNENKGKIAIVNQAFLDQNSKSIYTSNNLEKDLEDISKIDNKYKINVSGVEYVIVGGDFSVDYTYPVIDSENITVNTKNQALVYVNQFGYDRIKRSYPTEISEKYFLFTAKDGETPEQLQTKLNELSYRLATGQSPSRLLNINDDSNIYKTAYLSTESSLLNPERSLRLTVIDDMIQNLEKIQKFVGILLFTIVGIVILFFVRRYVASRSKALGILLAQGYSPLEIALSICLFPLFTSVIGAALGYIIGLVSQFALANLFSIFWTIPFVSIPFNWITFLTTLIVPIVFLSAITILATLWFLKKNKPISMMNGSMEISNTPISRFSNKLAIKTSVKNRFSVALAMGSLGKLFALFVSSLFTSTITLFYVASFKAFDTSINRTYDKKNYKYLISYRTPTVEGGNVEIIESQPDKSIDVDKMLYVPIGTPEEGYVYLSGYFRPGYNEIINKNGANGNVAIDDTTTPHMFTKFSMDLVVSSGGLNTSVWETLYNSLPESQRSMIVNSSYKSGNWIEWTQEGKKYVYSGNNYITRFVDFGQETEYLSLWDSSKKDFVKVNNQETGQMENIRINYFNYEKNDTNPELSKFIQKETKNNFSYIENELVITGTEISNKLRKDYRDFLVSAYNIMLNYSGTGVNPGSILEQDLVTKMPSFEKDFFMIPGGIMIDNNSELHDGDETFTYIDATQSENSSLKPRIYGFKKDSKFNIIQDEEGKNLIEIAQNFSKEVNGEKIYPLIINNVVKEKYSFDKNQIISFEINNTHTRFQDKLKNELNKIQGVNKEIINKKVKFQIIGISDTFINEEWTTSQEVANEILGLDINLYNGVISDYNEPSTLSNQISLYAHNGYWSADNKIYYGNNKNSSELTISEKTKIINTYNQIFYNEKIQNGTKINDSLMHENIKRIFPEYSSQEIDNLLLKLLGQESLKLSFDSSAPDQSINNKNVDIAISAIKKFVQIYSDEALNATLNTVLSNGIEKDFVQKASGLTDDSMTMILVFSFIVSLIILTIITTMIISENEKNIAIFGILGYTTKEKIRMFFSIYIPIVFASILFSILLVWLVLPAFLTAILSSTAIALPITINFVHVLISSGIISFVFAITCTISWIVQGIIKPIMLLKEV